MFILPSVDQELIALPETGSMAYIYLDWMTKQFKRQLAHPDTRDISIIINQNPLKGVEVKLEDVVVYYI